jgi:hypothetical protein
LKKINFIIIIFLLNLYFAASSFAATYYMSPGGSDSRSGTTEATAWRTFANAFWNMVAGDTLILLDGTYSESAGTGVINWESPNSSQPPSGTNIFNMTVVRAKTAGNVVVDGEGTYGLFIGRSTRKDGYIKIQGIRFEGGGFLYNTTHVMLKECGFHSTHMWGGAVLSVGAGDHSNGNTYNLIEDCWVWGSDRLIASNYRADYTIWRRVVIRGDGCNSAACTGSGNPNVGITVYESHYCSLQNVIVIDRILDGGEPYSDFATAEHTGGSYALGPNEWLGCISLKAPDMGYSFQADNANDQTVTMKNCVVWGSTSFGFNPSCPHFSNISLENLTCGNVGNDCFRVQDVISGTARNLISTNAGRYGYNSYVVTPSYVDVYNSAAANYLEGGVTCSAGCRTTNPQNDGNPASIKYIPRIETGSALKGTGYNAGDYGANVVKRYGTDGTFYGDTGYNTLTSVDLWPWPNEDRIKADLSTASTRGFCASGQTLTKYIWEYLGNTIPLEAPTDLNASALISSSILLGWTDNSVTEEGFKIERKKTESGTYSQIDTVAKDIFLYNDFGLDSSTPYYYRVRAYYADLDSDYSNEALATTLAAGADGNPGVVGGGGGGGEGCFIATAAFGTPLADEVKTLYDFRDRFLLTNKLGRIFVRFYYGVSPAIAAYIEKRTWTKKITRLLLKPIVWLAKTYEKNR